MPKKLDKLPLVEPMKSLRCASIFTGWKSQESVTDRIIQSDHWSLGLCNKSEAGKCETDQTQQSEHSVAPGAYRGERGAYAYRRVYLYRPKSTSPEGEGRGSNVALP